MTYWLLPSSGKLPLRRPSGVCPSRISSSPCPTGGPKWGGSGWAAGICCRGDMGMEGPLAPIPGGGHPNMDSGPTLESSGSMPWGCMLTSFCSSDMPLPGGRSRDGGRCICPTMGMPGGKRGRPSAPTMGPGGPPCCPCWPGSTGDWGMDMPWWPPVKCKVIVRSYVGDKSTF